MASNLEIKIKTIIEGLDGLTSLNKALAEVYKSASTIGSGTDGADGAITQMTKAMAEAGAEGKDLATEAAKVEATLKSLSDEAADTAADISSVEKVVSNLSTIFGAAQATVTSFSVGLEDVATAAQKAGTGLQDAGPSAEGLSKGLGDVGASAQGAGDDLTEAAGASENIKSKLQVLIEWARKAALGLSDYGAAADGAGGDSDEAGQRMSVLAQNIRNLLNQSKGASDGMASFEGMLEGLKNPATAGATAVELLTSTVKALLVPLLAMAGIKVSFDYLIDAAKYASKVETLGVTLGVVAQNAGYTKEQISEYEVELKKAGISTEAARNSMVQMMQAGLSLQGQLEGTTPQIVKMARAAQDLAVVTGENSSETLQRLIINVQQMDTMGMRFMGLSVDMTAAQEKFATSIGTTAGALSEAQKRQAVLNAAMESAAKLSGAYEASMESVGKKVSSMKRYTDELANSMGEKLLPMYGALVDEATLVLKGLQKQAEEFDKNGKVAAAYGAGTAAAIEPMGRAIEHVYAGLLTLGAEFAPVFEEAGSAIGELVSVLDDALTAVASFAGGSSSMSNALTTLSAVLAVVSDSLKVIRLGINALVYVAAEAGSSLAGVAASLADVIPGLGGMADQLKKTEDRLQGLADKSSNTVGQITNDFVEGNTEIYKMVEATREANDAMHGLDTGPSQKLAKSILDLTAEQINNHKSSVQVAQGHDAIKKSMDEALASNQISQKEYDKLSTKLGIVGSKLRDDLDASFKLLGVTTSQLATRVDADTASIIGALRSVADNGLATADQFQEAFATKVSMAKNVQELSEFSDLLFVAGARWPEYTDAFALSQENVSRLFEDMYTKQLATVSTQAQWDSLKESVVSMGDSGVLSVDQVTLALQRGEEQMNKLTPAYGAATEALKAIGATIASVSAEMDLLDAAIQKTSANAASQYGEMAAGYKTLSEAVRAQADLQLEAVNNRYNAELALIDRAYTGTEQGEQKKLALFLKTEEEKVTIAEASFAKQQEYDNKSIEASTKAAEARIKALDGEAAKVSEALGSQKSAREDYERQLRDIDSQRLKITSDLEEEIKIKKLENLTRLKDGYTQYINALLAEEDRHLGKVKSIEQEIKATKQQGEDDLKAIMLSGMSDYEKYEVYKSDVTKYQEAARTASYKGEYDVARDMLAKAREAALELNTAVEEGNKVYVSKEQAAKNASQAIEAVNETTIKILEREKAAQVEAAEEAHRAAAAKQADLADVNSKLQEVQQTAARKTEVNITANADAVTKAVADLDQLIEARARLIPVQVDLKAAQNELTMMQEAIAKGTSLPVTVETEQARAALDNLKTYATETNNAQLVLNTEQAQVAITGVKDSVTALNDVKTTSHHTVTVVGAEKLQDLKGIHAEDGVATSSSHNVESNATEVAGSVTAIVKEDGKTTTSTHTVETNAAEVQAEVDAIHTANDGRATTSSAMIDSNAAQVRADLEVVLTPQTVSDTVTINTNAVEAKAAIDGVMTPRPPLTTSHTVTTNAADVKPVLDKALTPTSVTSSHTVSTNAEVIKGTLMPALTPVAVSSEHNINTDAQTKKPLIEAALVEQHVSSQHTLVTNAETVLPGIREALTARQIESKHTVVTNISAVMAQLEALGRVATQSMHTIITNAQQALAEIRSLNGANTSSEHIIYVRKVYVNAEGGPIGGGTGPAVEQYMSAGIVPGVANYDSVPRALDAGSFVLRKSAVQQFGAANILGLMDKAKQLPKSVSGLAGRVSTLLMPGEIVVDKDTASRLGRGFLTSLNNGVLPGALGPRRFAVGGAVGDVPDLAASLTEMLQSPTTPDMATHTSTAVNRQEPTSILDLRTDRGNVSVAVPDSQAGTFVETMIDMMQRS